MFHEGKMKTPHPPGSPEAVKLGCLCPISDNRHGRGAFIDSSSEPVYWYDLHCPLHGGKLAEQVKQDEILFELKNGK
jgi:hypothetical protein